MKVRITSKHINKIDTAHENYTFLCDMVDVNSHIKDRLLERVLTINPGGPSKSLTINLDVLYKNAIKIKSAGSCSGIRCSNCIACDTPLCMIDPNGFVYGHIVKDRVDEYIKLYERCFSNLVTI